MTSSRGRVAHALRALPTLLRVGLSELIAYRAEFLVWILTTNMPLLMMALWTAVAAKAPVGRFGARDFVAYFLGALIVRLVTNSWLVWELTMDIRQGTIATRLLRPLHPLLAYAAQHAAAVPMRALVVSPAFVVLAVVVGNRFPWRDPLLLAALGASLVGAWVIQFSTMVLIGSLALYVQSALSVFELWLGVSFVLSGYLVPLELLPGWVARLAAVLPFRYTLALPVETMIGLLDRAAVARQLGVQWAYAAAFVAAALTVWRRGMRRLVAFGG